ncbi:hypothetical protein GEV33_014918 [Tenebrio molitor]|uniref:Uncharacterized protein n=1 Tax=Tenebrio molitor TaxID=7067 RepID=A0A8J6H5X1_TENMO|nr:hypothetical protein GEV33_014918 [Tenebrio molitor]
MSAMSLCFIRSEKIPPGTVASGITISEEEIGWVSQVGDCQRSCQIVQCRYVISGKDHRLGRKHMQEPVLGKPPCDIVRVQPDKQGHSVRADHDLEDFTYII